MTTQLIDTIESQKEAQLEAAIAYNMRFCRPSTYIQTSTEEDEKRKQNREKAVRRCFNNNYERFCFKEHKKATAERNIGRCCTTVIGTSTLFLIGLAAHPEANAELRAVLLGFAVLAALTTYGFGTQTKQCARYAEIIKPIANTSKQRE